MTTAEREIARRRTFAIISHPDAGKTTLTEKFLLYGGAVQLAGSVTSRKNDLILNTVVSPVPRCVSNLPH